MIYIAGYGRSGSTLLERILAIHPKIVGCGEIVNIFRASKENELCSCGKLVSSCELWGEVLDNCYSSGFTIEGYQREINKSEPLQALFYQTKHREKSKQLYDSLFSLNSQYSHIIDSSKTTNRSTFRALSISEHTETKMIHIVRNGVSVLNSNLRGDNMKIQRGEKDITYTLALLRTMLSWPLANLAAHWFSFRKGKNSYLRIRFEDLILAPAETLNKISIFLELDLVENIRHIENSLPIPITHQISGNRMRTKTPLFFISQLSEPDKVRWYHKIFFHLFTWPFLAYYGYYNNKNILKCAE